MIRTAVLALTLLFAASAAHSQMPGGRLGKITSSYTVNIAYRVDATPFSFLNDSKQPVGFSVDICRRVVQSLERQLGLPGLKVNWVPVTTATRFDAVAKGEADMECSSSTVTLARMKQVDFSTYIFVESTGLLVRAASGMRSVTDLAGKTVAVVAGTTNENVIRAQVKGRRLDSKVVTFKTREDAFAAFEAGKADAFASDKLLLIGIASKSRDPKSLALLADDLSFEPYGIVLPRGDSDFRLAVNTALAEIFRTGQIGEIFGRWFGGFGDPGPVIGILYLLGAIPE